MYSQNTRSEFIRLRVQGLSLASIGRRLGVSKPTVIKWNRQLRLAAPKSDNGGSPLSCVSDEVAALTRRLTALKQELFSRALREIPTATLETLAGELRQRLETLQPATSTSAPPAAPESSGGDAASHVHRRSLAERPTTILPLPGGPRIAERSTPVGQQTGGGLGTTILAENVSRGETDSWRPWEGNPLGRGEGPAAVPSFQHSTTPVPEPVRT